eukprot:1891797-Amphidinium_carterae.1
MAFAAIFCASCYEVFIGAEGELAKDVKRFEAALLKRLLLLYHYNNSGCRHKKSLTGFDFHCRKGDVR